MEFEGKIFSWTQVSREAVPSGFEDQAPYYVALIELMRYPGRLLTAMLTDMDRDVETGRMSDPEIGMEVEGVVRRLKFDGDQERGMVVYGMKFRPRLKWEKNE